LLTGICSDYLEIKLKFYIFGTIFAFFGKGATKSYRALYVSFFVFTGSIEAIVTSTDLPVQALPLLPG
jgi:hypothetical protein